MAAEGEQCLRACSSCAATVPGLLLTVLASSKPRGRVSCSLTCAFLFHHRSIPFSLHHEMKPSPPVNAPALLPASQNRPTASLTSSPPITLPSAPLARAKMPAGASSCSAYRRLTLSPCLVSSSSASGLREAEILRPCCAGVASESDGEVAEANSSFARVSIIRRISGPVYGCVGTISNRGNRSGGMPCAETSPASFCEVVPRIVVRPRLDARITMGESGDSSARLR